MCYQKNGVFIFFSITLSCLLFTSCLTFHKVQDSPARIKLDNKNIDAINGSYKGSRGNNPYIYDIPSDTLRKYPGDSLKLVSLRVVDHSKIEIGYFYKGVLITSKTYKGKIKNGYFRFNYNGKFKTIKFGLINFYQDQIVRTGILENGNLTADWVSSGTGLLIILPFGVADTGGHGEYVSVN